MRKFGTFPNDEDDDYDNSDGYDENEIPSLMRRSGCKVTCYPEMSISYDTRKIGYEQ